MLTRGDEGDIGEGMEDMLEPVESKDDADAVERRFILSESGLKEGESDGDGDGGKRGLRG